MASLWHLTGVLPKSGSDYPLELVALACLSRMRCTRSSFLPLVGKDQLLNIACKSLIVLACNPSLVKWPRDGAGRLELGPASPPELSILPTFLEFCFACRNVLWSWADTSLAGRFPLSLAAGRFAFFDPSSLALRLCRERINRLLGSVFTI